MKILLAILAVTLAPLSGLGQSAVTMRFQLQTDGALSLSWPVVRPYPREGSLAPTYRVEIASELGQWQSAGEPIRGADFTAAVEIQIANLRGRPASFVRVEAIHDFSYGIFPRKTLTNAVLPGARFAGADLFAARLTDSRLGNVDFSGANLRGARLERIDARGADFTTARLRGAFAAGADFRGAKFLFAELSDVDLASAMLDGADLRGAILEGATNSYTRFHGSIISELTIMDPKIRAIWQIVNQQAAGRNLGGMNLTFCDLSGGDVRGANLSNCDLSGTDLPGANLSGANFSNANLRFVNLFATMIDAQTILPSKWRLVWDIINNPQTARVLTGAELSAGFWVRPNLERADVRSASFASGIMIEPNFLSATAISVSFANVQFAGGDFRSADLRNANFSGAFLEDVNFRNANITGATFAGAIFRRTIFPDGSIRN